MSPRANRWLLGAAVLVFFALGPLTADGSAPTTPAEREGFGPCPLYSLGPPAPSGGGETTDGGDPDEVVIFIVSPGDPVVTTGPAAPSCAIPRKISFGLAEFRSLLFWVGVTR